jgi:hypothetical protein
MRDTIDNLGVQGYQTRAGMINHIGRRELSERLSFNHREDAGREKNSKSHRRAAEHAEESFFKNTDFQTCYPLRSLRTPRLGGEVLHFF